MTMKKLRYLFSILLLSFLLMGSQCQTTSTVVTPQGPTAIELNAVKDEQIATLKKQAEEQKAQRNREQAEASKAASSVKGILKANEYQPKGRPTEAIEQEASVALTRLPPDDPAETVKSLQRAVEMVEKDRDNALAMYATARKDAEAKQQVIVAKDKELEKRDKEIATRETQIIDLTKAAQIEGEEAAKLLQKTIDAKDKELRDFKAEMASKERSSWVLWTRIVGLGFIVIGAVAAIVFKVIPEGASFVGVGVLIGLISIFISWLTSQPWFMWLCLGVFGIVIALAVYATYRIWKKHDEERKAATDTYRSLQRVKDKNPETWNTVLKPELEEGNTKYVEKDGVITKETDPERATFIDKRLAETGDK